MNNPRKDLTDYFDAFRDTERMSEQAAWDILERATDPDPVVPPIPIETKDDDRRKRRMIYLMLGLLALVGSALLIDMSVEEPAPVTRPVSRPSAGIPEKSKAHEPVAAQEAPAQQKPVSRYMDTYRSRSMAAVGGLDHPLPLQPSMQKPAPSDSVTVDTIFKLPNKSADPPTPIIQGPAEMPGVRVLDLTRDELITFGLVPDDKGAGMFMRTGSNRTFFHWVGYLSSGMYSDSLPPAVWPAPTLDRGPVLTTKRDGGLYMSFVDDKELAPELSRRMRTLPRGSEEEKQAFEQYRKLHAEYLDSITPTLIPVLVRTGAEQNHNSAEDMVIWFQPRPVIIANLPHSIRDRITQEVQAANEVSRDLITQADALRSGMTPTLDLIRSASGSITRSTLTRNGASYEIQLSLAEPRTLRVELFDIEGRRLDQLVPMRDLPFGDHAIGFDVNRSGTGIYLIVVTSDKHERAMHRVFIKKD